MLGVEGGRVYSIVHGRSRMVGGWVGGNALFFHPVVDKAGRAGETRVIGGHDLDDLHEQGVHLAEDGINTSSKSSKGGDEESKKTKKHIVQQYRNSEEQAYRNCHSHGSIRND